jgi:transcriptional regulator NrdR family protein
MLCPECKADTRVLDSREMPDNSVYRRRECLAIRSSVPTHRFSTSERSTTVSPRHLNHLLRITRMLAAAVERIAEGKA